MPEEETMTPDEYERKAQSLVGNTITKVVYHEVDYCDGEFHFFDDPRFDSLDHGLELSLGKSDSLCITWGAEFHQYGVSLVSRPMSMLLSQSRSLDVSHTSRWQPILRCTINSVRVFWSWCEESGKPETRVHYPQDVLLEFAGNKPIIISALEIRDDGFVMGMMDNITVFDDVAMARQFKCMTEA